MTRYNGRIVDDILYEDGEGPYEKPVNKIPSKGILPRSLFARLSEKVATGVAKIGGQHTHGKTRAPAPLRPKR